MTVLRITINGRAYGPREVCDDLSINDFLRGSIGLTGTKFGCGAALNEGQVLLERLAKKPVSRADLEKTIAEALDGHLCRCTGYIKYHEAVRDVIQADPARYLVAKVEREDRRDDSTGH